jgi:hypothetical protein
VNELIIVGESQGFAAADGYLRHAETAALMDDGARMVREGDNRRQQQRRD